MPQPNATTKCQIPQPNAKYCCARYYLLAKLSGPAEANEGPVRMRSAGRVCP
jgi:hypothetical protein